MKAARLVGPASVTYQDVPQPFCEPDEVLVKVECVGVCGTDVEMYHGTMAYFQMGWTEYPITLGHEWSGVVVERGDEVTHLQVGDRVTGDVTIGCFQCENCKRGDYNLCLSKIEVGLCRGKDGAYADYLTMPARHTYRLPDGVDFEEAAMTEPAATVVKAIRKARLNPGAYGVVFGDGPIGLLGMQAMIACGAGRTLLVGTYDRKLALGSELGCDLTVNVNKEDISAIVDQETAGRGADFVMEASGNPEALKQASMITRMGGTISVVGLYETPIQDFDMGSIVVRDIDLISSVASPNVFDETLRLMAAGKIKAKPLVSHRFPLAKASEAFDVQIKQIEQRDKILLLPN
jgi:2-desacetyl-2-hydroxyethyl bacteriochlorophyllide A dehydrogenase